MDTVTHTAPTADDLDGLRAVLHQMWAGVAPAWAARATHVDARSAPVTQAMLDVVRPLFGARVLELACGPGGVGLAAAELIGPEGSVVMSDVAVEMTTIAAGRAEARGLGKISTRTLDLERIDEPDSSHDVVLCREALMLVPEPARAVREMCRVLRPGGRAAVAVWGPRARNPWLGALLDAVTAHTGVPVPPPGVPGPFSLGDADALAALMRGAGLAHVAVVEVPAPLRVASFQEWWTVVGSLAGPLAHVLASLPGDTVGAIRASARETLAAHTTADGYELPGVSLVGSGRKE